MVSKAQAPTQNIIQSYLGNKKQYVQVNNVRSHCKALARGVPKKFIRYKNVSTKYGLLGKMILYADDASLFYTGPQDQTLKDIKQDNQKSISDKFAKEGVFEQFK